MNTNIWETELSAKLQEEITNYLKNINENKTYLLDALKNEFCLIEKYVYDIAYFHLKNMGFDINKNYIVFELKNTIKFSESNNISIDINNNKFQSIYNDNKNDENKNDNNNNKIKYCNVLLSCESYFNQSNYSTIITEIDLENYKYKEFDKKNKIQFFFPEEYKHITFEGNRFHGVLNIFDEPIDNEFLSITINLLDDKPSNINYFNNNIKEHSKIYFKEQSIINIKNNNINLKKINKEGHLFDYKFYENIFYSNKGKINLPSEVLNDIKKHLYTEKNKPVNDFVFIDNYENNIDTINNTKNELISNQISTIRKLDCNKNIINNNLLYNRFIQRITYNNIFSKNVCEWIINECELYVNTNGWNINKYNNKITQYLEAEKIKNIFGFILFSLNDIFNRIIKSYSLTLGSKININDIFIIKNEKNTTNIIKENTPNNLLTIYILLSDTSDFKGGGYYFDDGISEFLNQGDLIIHSSKIKNTELEIYDGKKYVLVVHIDLSI
jgi:hypothetical protein